MKHASEFSVPAAPAEVFSRFFDPETMRHCIPGCQELVRVNQHNYRGLLVNEIAHVRFSAGFTAAVESVTESDAESVVRAVLKGEDRRLGSSIKIDALMSVRPDGSHSTVGYELEMALWGKLGRLGEAVIQRRTKEVENQFAAALVDACRGEPEAGDAQVQAAVADPAPVSRRGHRTVMLAGGAGLLIVLLAVARSARRR